MAARAIVFAMAILAWQVARADTGEQGGAPAVPPAPVRPEPVVDLAHLRALLAQRAELHRSLLYRFQCIENLTRRVQRRPGYLGSGFIPEETVHLRYGIVVEKGEEGVAKVVRTKVDHEGRVKLDRHGRPVEADLPALFDPVEHAVPHAQAATFTSQNQADLVFHLLSDMEQDEPIYRIKCPEGHVAIEFLDRKPPRFSSTCHADSSGQMCVDPGSGEVSALVLYGLDREIDGCFWNRVAPFAMIEQGLIENKTGARFPSRVTTIYSVSSRDNAVFEQRYEDCGFTHVEVTESYGHVATDKDQP